jgi:ribonuclease BN (tRNA processing enzyme)
MIAITARFQRIAAAALGSAAILAAPLHSSAEDAHRSSSVAAHSTKIVLLGTKAGPGIIKDRSEAATLLVVDGAPYLIDAGAGVTRQIERADYSIYDIFTIFITHHHLDHTAGLEPLLASIANHKINAIGTGHPQPPTVIYGPPATAFLVDLILKYASVSERIFRAGMPSLAPLNANMFQAHDITQNGQVMKDDKVTVTAVENTHFSHPSYGPDGVKDMSFSYRFSTPSGSVVFTGDTGPSEAVTTLAMDADVLVSEVFQPFIWSGPEEPETSQAAKELAAHMATEHLTSDEVGKMAARAHIKTLIITHIAAIDDAKNMEAMRAGIRRWFHGKLIIGADFSSFDLKGQS